MKRKEYLLFLAAYSILCILLIYIGTAWIDLALAGYLVPSMARIGAGIMFLGGMFLGALVILDKYKYKVVKEHGS